MNFRGPLKEKIGRQRYLNVKDEGITLEELVYIISEQDWGSEVIENGHIKSPVILLIDGKLVQVSSTPNLFITKKSKLDFMIMFAGG